MTYKKVLLSAAAVAALTFSGCGGGGSSTSSSTSSSAVAALDCSTVDYTTPTGTDTLSGDITTHTLLTSETTWILDGLVAVKDNTCLKIEAGTTIAGKNGTADATSYMVIDKGSKIIAEGTATEPIVFTSELAVNGTAAAVGQWGGLTLIGNAGNSQVGAYEVNEEFVPGTTDMEDSSGILKHVKILNSGITMAEDKEINGLSMVGVGSGTSVDNITVELSDDDGVEIWGGTVNVSNVTISGCTDDHFDIDDGYSGTVTNLVINQDSGNAAIEMSGNTAATFNNVTITQDASAKEGGIFFKKDGIGGFFTDVTITDNVDDSYGAIYSQGAADTDNISFTNCTINGTSTGDRFTNADENSSAAAIQAIFEADASNTLN